MEWNHILDSRPEDGSIIIQIDMPYEFYKGDFKYHYSMGMRQWDGTSSWNSDIEKWNEWGWKPNFWWVYAKDFIFPNPKE